MLSINTYVMLVFSYSGTDGNLQNDMLTDVTLEIQPCGVLKKSSQTKLQQGHRVSTGERLQSENNQKGRESHKLERAVVGQERTEQEMGRLEEQVKEERLVKQDKEQEYETEDEQSGQVGQQNRQLTQERSAEEEEKDELAEEGVDEGCLEEQVEQEGHEIEQVEQLTEQEVEQVEQPHIEQQGHAAEEKVDQENIIRNTPADVDSTHICHSELGASVKESHSYVDAIEETKMETFADENIHEGSADEAKSYVLVQPCNVEPTNAARHYGDATKMDDTSPIGSSTNATDSHSRSTLINYRDDGVVRAQYNVTDDGDVAMVGSTDAQESTEELAQSPSALGEGIGDAVTYLEFASAVRLISNVLQRSSPTSESQDNVTGAATTLSYESKMDTVGSTISDTDAAVALSAAAGGDFNQTASVQQIDGSNQVSKPLPHFRFF